MKILAVTPAFHPQIGGIEIVVQELAVQLKALGHTVDIAHISAEHKTASADIVAGITVYRVPLWGGRLVGIAPKFQRLMDNGYDVLHVHDPQLLAISLTVRLFGSGLPAVLSTHGGFRHTKNLALLKNIFEKLMLRTVLKRYRQVLASSSSDLQYFSAYSRDVVLCENGVNTKLFGSVIRKNPADPRKWIYWGRLSKNKRVDLVIDVVARAKKRGRAINLLICGRDFEGLAAGYRKQVTELGLGAQVHFVEHLSEEELIGELGNRSVYITASEHEGFGLSNVEALSAGLIVVCRDMDPVNRFINPGSTGYFLAFDSGSADDDVVDQILATSTQRMSASSLLAQRSAERFNWTAASERFESVLKRAVGN